MMPGIVIEMEEARLHTLAQVRAFLDGATEIVFQVPKVERYSFVEWALLRFGYAAARRVGKGVLLRYLALLTGLSRQQVTRLVWRYRQEGTLSTRPGQPQHGFCRRYRHGRGLAVRHGRAAWHRVRHGHQDIEETGRPAVRGCALRATGGHFAAPSLQPLGQDPIPASATALDPNAVHRRPHRPAPSASAE